jgi:hypothetical protein
MNNSGRDSVGDQQLRGDTHPYTGIHSSTLRTESLTRVEAEPKKLSYKTRKHECLKSSKTTKRKHSLQGRLTISHYKNTPQNNTPTAKQKATHNTHPSLYPHAELHLRGDTLPYTGILSSTLSTESLSRVEAEPKKLSFKTRKPEGLKSSLKTERTQTFQGRLTHSHCNLSPQSSRPPANLLGTNNCGGTLFHTLVYSLVPLVLRVFLL